MENLKRIVHITGMVELDADGLPERIAGAAHIHALDMAEATLVLRRAESIQPAFEDGQVVLRLPALNIVASGTTREAAIEELALDLIWLWKEYALAPREGLSQDAQELAERLRGMIEEASMGNGQCEMQRD
jgi:hypothetical protein